MSKKMEKGTENAIFLDGREYTAADLYRLIGLLVGNGVYANELAPTATNENMSITHGVGHAWISGVAYWNTTPFILDIATADGSLNRYDSLMLRLDLSANETYAIIVQGAYATNPTPPACTRNAETFDLKLCDIYIPAGCTKITQDQIIDTRLDASVCGVPVFPVEHLDMTSFYRQIATDLTNFQQSNEADFNAWVEDQKDSNLSAMSALVEVVRNTSNDSKAEILNLLAQLNNLVAADTVGELIIQINDKLSKQGGKMTGALEVVDPQNENDAVPQKYVEQKKLPFYNVAIPVSSFVADTTYADYPYRAAVALSGVMESMIPEVVFTLTDAVSGNFAPVAACYNGGVYIYAAEAPVAAVTVPTILCWRGENGEALGTTNAGGSGGMSMELLWENASPESAFPGQTIALDLSKYRSIRVHFYPTSTGTKNEYRQELDVGSRTVLVAWNYILSKGESVIAESRQVSANETSVIFIDARTKVVTSTSVTETNTAVIPFAIYGIK